MFCQQANREGQHDEVDFIVRRSAFHDHRLVELADDLAGIVESKNISAGPNRRFGDRPRQDQGN